MDPKDFESHSKAYDEILEYAEGKMANELKDRHVPKTMDFPAEAEAKPSEDELDAESMARLAEMAGE